MLLCWVRKLAPYQGGLPDCIAALGTNCGACTVILKEPEANVIFRQVGREAGLS